MKFKVNGSISHSNVSRSSSELDWTDAQTDAILSNLCHLKTQKTTSAEKHYQNSRSNKLVVQAINWLSKQQISTQSNKLVVKIAKKTDLEKTCLLKLHLEEMPKTRGLDASQKP